MKRKFFIIFITSIYMTGLSQAQQRPRHAASMGTPILPMFIEDITGKPFLSLAAEGIDGSPFLFEGWNWGAVKFRNNKYAKDVSLHFNVYNNKLYFKRLDEQLEFIEPVHEFMIGYLNNMDSVAVLYRSGYPPSENNTFETFYEVLADGKIQLLKFRYKTISEYKPYNLPERKKFIDKEQLYAYSGGNTLTKIKRDKEFLLQTFPEYATVIAEIIEEKKLKLKNDHALIELFSGLNKK